MVPPRRIISESLNFVDCTLVSCKRGTGGVRSYQQGTQGESDGIQSEIRGGRQLRPTHQWCLKARMQAWFQALAFISVVTLSASAHEAVGDPV